MRRWFWVRSASSRSASTRSTFRMARAEPRPRSNISARTSGRRAPPCIFAGWVEGSETHPHSHVLAADGYRCAPLVLHLYAFANAGRPAFHIVREIACSRASQSHLNDGYRFARPILLFPIPFLSVYWHTKPGALIRARTRVGVRRFGVGGFAWPDQAIWL